MLLRLRHSFLFLALFSSLGIAGTPSENRKAFEGLPAYHEIETRLTTALGAQRAQQYLIPIAERWDQDSVLNILDKYVVAEEHTDMQEKFRAKALVIRDDLEVEKEIWRRILGKNNPNAVIPNEDQREEVVEALTGEWLIRSLSASYRADLKTQIVARKAAREAAQKKKEARLAAAREKEQGRRTSESYARIEDWRSIQDQLIAKRVGRDFLSRSDAMPKKPEVKAEDTTTSEATTERPSGSMPTRDEVKALILEELRQQREGKVHGAPQGTEVHK